MNDVCTCQGGDAQPHGAQLRANDCPLHGEMDDEPWYMLDDPELALELGSKVVEMADRLRVAHAVAPGAAASYSFELDGHTYSLRMKVASK